MEHPRHVPLTMGSHRAITFDARAFRVTEARFPAGLVLPPHLHDRASFAVVLEGSFDVIFGGRSYACPPSTVLTEPLGDKHGNRFGDRGVHVLVLQPDHELPDVWQPCGRLFDTVNHLHHGGIASMAWRLVRELRVPDAASPLAIEGMGLEMLALASRQDEACPRIPPSWLLRAGEFLQARFRQALTLEEIARAADVHPVHLARVFKRYYRQSIGAYIRRLRLDWAARQLATTDAPIAQIALDAGFADQSHFTRVFKRYVGLTPCRYRKAIKG